MFGAIDIGGTKTLVAVFDDQGNILKDIKFQTPQDYSEFKKELRTNFDSLDIKKFRIATVAVPGLLDKNKAVGIAFGNLPWTKVPIREDVEHIFHCPVIVENDARLAGLSEATALEKDYRKVLYLTISTGIGGGLIIDHKISPDFDTIEPGHILLEHNGELKRWEDFASGKAIFAEFGKKAKDITDPQAWDSIAKNIALGVIDLIATLTPDIIILGGGVGAHFDKFKTRLLEDLAKYADSLLVVPPIVEAKRAEEAVIYGCYELGKSNYDRIS